MSKITIEFEGFERGTHVYVSIGNLTVKAGKVVAHRITQYGHSPTALAIEYSVAWFGPEDRGANQEWIASRDVHLSPDSAFGISPITPPAGEDHANQT